MSSLTFASTPEQRVHPVEPAAPGQTNPLIQLVNPTTKITDDIRKKLDKVLDGDGSVSFNPAEKKAIAYNPTIRIETVSDYDRFRSAETKERGDKNV